MIALVADILSWACLLAGGAFAIIGGIGLMRMPDLYTRMQAAGLTDTLGAGLILAGLMIQGGLGLVTVKLALILAFLLFTSPVSAYALAQAASHAGYRPHIGTRDERRIAAEAGDDDDDLVDL